MNMIADPMSNPSTQNPPLLTSTECLFDTVFSFMLPIFLVNAGGDVRLARQSIIDLLDAYQAATAAELVLVAQIISFSHAAMDSLVQSMRPGLADHFVLRYRNNATAMNRSAEQSRKALFRMQANRPEPPQDDYLQPDHPAAQPDRHGHAGNHPTQPSPPQDEPFFPSPAVASGEVPPGLTPSDVILFNRYWPEQNRPNHRPADPSPADQNRSDLPLP